MAVAPINSEIVIDGETFDLVCIPNAKSRMVQKAKADLLGELNLQSFAEDLGNLGKFIRVAYNGVAGNTELQIKVQRVGYKIAKLADKSAVTVQKFKGAAQSVLQDLKSTYQYLMDGLEDMALETMTLLIDVAVEMVEAAHELRGDFEKAENDVREALEETQRLEGNKDVERKDLEKFGSEFEIEKKKAEEIRKGTLGAEETAAALYKEAQAREDKAMDQQESVMQTLKDAFTGGVGALASALAFDFESAKKKLSKVGDKTPYVKAQKIANKEKLKHLEEMKEQRNLRRQASVTCLEFAEKIARCQNEHALTSSAIDALHMSIGQLKALSTIMMDAARFWNVMQEHCKSLAKKDMQKLIQKAMEGDGEERLKTWTSRGFKTSALKYYTKWVAIDDVCGVYMLQIRNTREDLYKYLKENPTIEQAKMNVRHLAKDFAKDLHQAQKKLEEDRRKEIE